MGESDPFSPSRLRRDDLERPPTLVERRRAQRRRVLLGFVIHAAAWQPLILLRAIVTENGLEGMARASAWPLVAIADMGWPDGMEALGLVLGLGLPLATIASAVMAPSRPVGCMAHGFVLLYGLVALGHAGSPV